MLQKYKSHKIVEAGKIQGIHFRHDLARDVVTHVQVGGRQYDVPADFNSRGTPEVGDYFLRYKDGYLSWIPAAKFAADEYTLIEDATGGVQPGESQSSRSNTGNTSTTQEAGESGTSGVASADSSDDDVQQDGSVDAGNLETHG